MNAKDHARKMLVKRNHPLFEAPSKPKKETSTEKVVVQKKEAVKAEKTVTDPEAVKPVEEVKTTVKKATKKKVDENVKESNLDDKQ